MMTEYQSIYALIDKIKGTTGFLSSLFFHMPGLIITLIVLGMIFSRLLEH